VTFFSLLAALFVTIGETHHHRHIKHRIKNGGTSRFSRVEHVPLLDAFFFFVPSLLSSCAFLASSSSRSFSYSSSSGQFVRRHPHPSVFFFFSE
jgi:sorbitol-specific phosphotransferase system component IIC